MILLDTHVVLWMSSNSSRLSTPAREAILQARESTGVAVATFTLFELAWIAEKRRIPLSESIEKFVSETVSRLILRPMTAEIAARAVRMPATYPKDPADRIIAATALVESMPLVTADQRIRESGVVKTIW